jgi:hypothetical protein
MVASETRKARAISSVWRPPSVRSVSATWGIEGERRVAAGEEELEPLVRDRRLVHVVLHRFRHVEQASLRGERVIAADAVDRAVARGGHEPGARVGGRPVAGPALGGDREGFLGGFLGEVEVAEEADQVARTRPHSSRKACSRGTTP